MTFSQVKEYDIFTSEKLKSMFLSLLVSDFFGSYFIVSLTDAYPTSIFELL